MLKTDIAADAISIRPLKPHLCTDLACARATLFSDLLPKLKSPQLQEILAIDVHSGSITINSRAIPNTTPLSALPFSSLPSPHENLFQIFGDLCRAIETLSSITPSFAPAGLAPLALRPEEIAIDTSYHATLLNFLEDAICYGHDEQALFEAALEHSSVDFPQNLDPYAWAKLLYRYVTGKTLAPGAPSLAASAGLPSFWDECLRACDTPTITWQSLLARFCVQSAPPTPSPKTQLLRLKTPKNMRLIAPDSPVTIGASNGPSLEQPAHSVSIEPFYIDETPVTNAQFRAFDPSKKPSKYSSDDEMPVTEVSLEEAKAYCRFRSLQEGLSPDAYQLPKEVQWEAACVAESHLAHAGKNEVIGALNVRGVPCDSSGLYHMLGNTWEWTSSPLKPHPGSKLKDQLPEGTLQCAKGGCWCTPKANVRPALRKGFDPKQRHASVGFRCVRASVAN